MPYPALELITQSYYLSQVVSRELQEVSDNQIFDGLYLLNALLSFKSTDTRLIPYYTYSTWTGVVGQEMYYFPNLLLVDTLTFNIDQVRYSMNEFTRTQYFEISRVDNISSLPFCYRVERVLGGANIYVYFLPSQPFIFHMNAKYSFPTVTLQTDLTLTFDFFYIEFLRYALAEYICSEYGATFPDESKMKLEELTKKVSYVSPPDLSIQSDNFFDKGFGIDWQTANLSKGWWPF